MLTIDDKAINTIRKGNSVLVIKSVVNSCGWGGTPTRSLWIETQKNFSPSEQYILMEYEGVKVYLQKGLILNEDIHVYQKLKIPFLGSIFGVKGVRL